MAFTDRIFPTEADRLAHTCGAFDRDQQWKVAETFKLYKIARQGVGDQCWVFLYTDAADSVRAGAATADVDVYIDPVDGDDDAAGTSVAPVRTWSAARALTPIDDAGYMVAWHLAAGTHYVSEIPPSVSRVYADAAWDSAARTTVATISAAAGTSASQVVTTGLVANAHRGQWLYHSATGQLRLIAENSTTTIYPTADFSPAAAEGDAVLVLESAVVLSPAVGAASPVVMWQSSKDRALEGVRVSASGNTMRVVGGALRLLGVDVAAGTLTVTGESASGFAAVASSLTTGWGTYVRSGATLRLNSWASGHVVQMGTIRTTAMAELDGHFDSVDAVVHFRGLTILGGNSGGRTTIGDASSTGARVSVTSRGNLTVRQATVRGSHTGALISVSGSGDLHLNTVTALNAGTGPTVRAEYGGRVTIYGNPTAVGDGSADDFQIDDLGAANTAFSTLSTAYQVSARASFVQRAF